eukprot:gene1102-10616_t
MKTFISGFIALFASFSGTIFLTILFKFSSYLIGLNYKMEGEPVQRRVTTIKNHLKDENEIQIEKNDVSGSTSSFESDSIPFIHYPYTLDDLQDILKQVKENNERIKIISSLEEAKQSTSVLISLEKFSTLLQVNEDNNTIKVETGATLKQLVEELKEHKMSFSNLPSNENETIYSVLAYGVHGTSKKYGILSTMVLEIELLIASGEILRLSKDENYEIYLACLCNLGCLGIPITVTIQLEKQFNLNLIQRPIKFEYVLKNSGHLIEREEFIKFCWFPHTKNCITWRANKTNEKINLKKSAIIISMIKEKLIYENILKLFLFITFYSPKMIPVMNFLYYFLKFKRERTMIDSSENIFFEKFENKIELENEWSIPLENVDLALKTIKEFLKKEGIKLFFPIQLKYTKKDDIYLSPSFGRDSCNISISTFLKNQNYKMIYFSGFEKIMKYFNGRPSWKNATFESKILNQFPKSNEFESIRQKLDAQKIFWNEIYEKVSV